MTLVHRPRRLRTTAAMRRLVREHQLHPHQLVQPLFHGEELTEPRAITAMPGVSQLDLDSLVHQAERAVAAGVGGIMLFAIPADRDATGSQACHPEGVLNRAIAAVKAAVGTQTVIMADLCLDEFTDHGHCGVLDADGRVDNDNTLAIYGDMAVALAQAGADVVAPSGMMDGQVGVIRAALDAAGFMECSILAYAAKYASACYGPFREAVDSQLVGDRRSYQQDPANRREAGREVDFDVAEGADIVMVKPAGWYLDVVADIAQTSPVPVWAYQVSGELAMVEAAAAAGWLDRSSAIAESLLCIRRAGADAIISYWATEFGEDWYRQAAQSHAKITGMRGRP